MSEKKQLAALVAVSLLVVGCGDGELSVEYPTISQDKIKTIASELRPEQRRERARLIRDAAARRGLTNGVLLAGIADSETNLAHCWSEARWACKGPASSSCGGGPVIAGSADGPCSARQGGLGMFQFDGGTYDQTLAREGRRILTVEGNTEAAVDFVVHRVKISEFVPGVNTNDEALAWMNRIRPETTEWDQWIRTVTGYYNGCFEGRCSVFHQRYNNYDTKTRNVLAEFGEDFWFGSSGPTDPGTSDPGPTDPGTSDPGTSDPGTSDPGTSDPGTSDPGTSDPGTSDPGTSQPSTSAPSTAADLNPVEADIPLGRSINLSWVAVGGASYTIRMDYLDGNTWKFYYEWTKNRSVFEVWPQASNHRYRWAIRACNANGCADWSDYNYFDYGTVASSGGSTGSTSTGSTSTGSTSTGSTSGGTTSGGSTSGAPTTSPDPVSTAPSAVGAPGLVATMSPAGTRVDTTHVPLRWSEPVDGETYDIAMYYLKNDEWTYYYVWENKTGGAFDVWPVVDETYYAWSIRACNASGCSAWSDFQQFYFGGL